MFRSLQQLHGKFRFFSLVFSRNICENWMHAVFMLKCVHNTCSTSFQILFSVCRCQWYSIVTQEWAQKTCASAVTCCWFPSFVLTKPANDWQRFWVCAISFKQELDSKLLKPQEIKFINLSDITIRFSMLKHVKSFSAFHTNCTKTKTFQWGEISLHSNN